MKPLKTLSHRERVERMRECAKAALAQYNLHDLQLWHAGGLDDDNMVFRVSALPQGGAAGRRLFFLRTYDPQQYSCEMIESELLWLRALRQGADLTVPEPAPGRNQGWVQNVAATNGVPSRFCVLFRQIEGKSLGDFPNENRPLAMIESTGVLVAKLHQHAQSFPPPEGFTRPRRDWERLFGESSALHRRGAEFYSQSELCLFAAASEKVHQVMEELGEGVEVFGLIHGDMTVGNVLIQSGEARPIDFCHCGFGYYMYDICYALVHLRQIEHDAFWAGYQRVLPPPEISETHRKAFKIAENVEFVNWALSWPSPDYHEWGPRDLKAVLNSLPRLLDRL